MIEPVYRYVLDKDNLIADVNDAWLSFAEQNGAKNLARNLIIGHNVLFSFAGERVTQLYEALFSKVRQSGSAVTLPFRCDSPNKKRYMELEIAPQSRMGYLQITGSLIREVAHPFIPLLDLNRPRNRSWLIICAICRKIKLADGTWHEIDDGALKNPYTDPPEGLPALAHGVCEACEAIMLRAIS